MGEIGISRREFLYDLMWWEVRSIIRGYNCRHHAGWEQARLVSYAICCTFAKDPPKKPEDLFTFTWEKSTIIPDEATVNELKSELNDLRNLSL